MDETRNVAQISILEICRLKLLVSLASICATRMIGWTCAIHRPVEEHHNKSHGLVEANRKKCMGLLGKLFNIIGIVYR